MLAPDGTFIHPRAAERTKFCSAYNRPAPEAVTSAHADVEPTGAAAFRAFLRHRSTLAPFLRQLATLGERERGTARLEQAVASFTEALKECTRERVPLDWAAMQNNLGTALATLGERERGTESLEQAVAAFTEALKERTGERVPFAPDMTQKNLGRAIQLLRERGRAF